MTDQKRSGLSGAQKGAVIVSGMVQIGLLFAALADIHRRPEEEIRGDKRRWAVVAFVDFVGPVSYFPFGRRG